MTRAAAFALTVLALTATPGTRVDVFAFLDEHMPAPVSRAARQPTSPLAVFTPLIGRDWEAELPGSKTTDTQHYEWVLGDKFVRNTHRVRLPDGQTVYEGETIYAWDARAERITWWYWNSSGGYVTGTVTVNPNGSLLAEGENRGPKNQLDRTRVLIQIRDGQWTMAASQEKDGKWTEQPPRIYRAIR